MLELIMQSFLLHTFNFYGTCLVSATLLSRELSSLAVLFKLQY